MVLQKEHKIPLDHVSLNFFLDCFVSILPLISWVRSSEKQINCKIYGSHEAENSEEADWQICNLIYRGSELEKGETKILNKALFMRP